MKYHFTFIDGKAIFASHVVKKEIEVNGSKEIIDIPVFSLKEAEAIDGIEIIEQIVPNEIIEKAESLAGKTQSKEVFEKMIYED